MSLKGKTIGLAVTGSFCTFDKIKQTVQTLIQEEAELYPIFSPMCRPPVPVSEARMNISGPSAVWPDGNPFLPLRTRNPLAPKAIWIFCSSPPVREIPLPSWQTASRIPPYSWLPKPICVMKSLWLSSFPPMMPWE